MGEGEMKHKCLYCGHEVEVDELNLKRRIGAFEAGAILGVTEATVRRYADTGLLVHEKDHAGRRSFIVGDVLKFQQAGVRPKQKPFGWPAKFKPVLGKAK